VKDVKVVKDKSTTKGNIKEVMMKIKRGGFPRTRLRHPGKNRKIKFTKSNMLQLIELVREEGKQRIAFTDAMTPGLKGVVSETGSITFCHQWTHWSDGKRVDRIGLYPGVSPELSREIILKRNAKIAQLLDPNKPDDDGIPKISEFILNDILEFIDKKYKRPATVKSQINCWILKFFTGDMDKPLNGITRKDVIKFCEWVASMRTDVTANRCRTTLSGIMNRAIDLEYIDRNPCQGIKKFREPESRTRIFSDDEFKRYCNVLMKHIDHQHAKILYLLVLLSLRFEEVASMEWDNIDYEKSEYTIPKTKNGSRRVIALNAPALDLLRQMHADRKDLENPHVFPARSESGHTINIRRKHKKILAESKIEGFRTHDIRRSGASALLNDFDANPLKIMEILGHKDMRSTLVYARLSAKSMAATSDLLAQKFNSAVNP
jgi:integrase